METPGAKSVTEEDRPCYLLADAGGAGLREPTFSGRGLSDKMHRTQGCPLAVEHLFYGRAMEEEWKSWMHFAKLEQLTQSQKREFLQSE